MFLGVANVLVTFSGRKLPSVRRRPDVQGFVDGKGKSNHGLGSWQILAVSRHLSCAEALNLGLACHWATPTPFVQPRGSSVVPDSQSVGASVAWIWASLDGFRSLSIWRHEQTAMRDADWHAFRHTGSLRESCLLESRRIGTFM